MKILIFNGEDVPKIKLPQQSLEILKSSKDSNNNYTWVMVPDEEGKMYVLRWK